MHQPTPPQAHQYIDDEIDLLPYIRHIIAHWRWFVVASIAAVIVAMGLALVLPKQYQASTTFFVPEVSSSGSGSALMAQFGFFSSFDGGVSGQYSGYMVPIFESRRIKQHVANQLLAGGWFDAMPSITSLNGTEKMDAIIGFLRLVKKAKLELEEGVYTITFRHKDPRMVLPVLTAYLTALIELNDELNIDADRLQIVPLDEAVFPKSHIFPDFKILIFVFNIIFFIFILIYLIIQKLFFIKNVND